MEGYAKIAQRMAGLPSLAIFRRFQALRAQDLLYMQAELVELEQRLRGQAVEDSQSSNQTEKLFSRDWHTLSKRNDGGEYNEQWRLALEIREKLEKYGMSMAVEARDRTHRTRGDVDPACSPIVSCWKGPPTRSRHSCRDLGQPQPVLRLSSRTRQWDLEGRRCHGRSHFNQ